MDGRGLLRELPAITAITVLGLGLLTLGLGYPWFWVVFVVGFAAGVPLSAIISDALLDEEAAGDEGEDQGSEVGEQEALDALRERYARGEIDEATFERQVDRLLETETVAEAREWVRDQRVPEPDGDPEGTDAETERT